ncbi:phage tail protein [Enterobacter roggenkampii]|uniref:phage tail protein n=1 Tax=Enterobacter roggenkampii TaxID=1812935 RepID=UPI0021CA2700|nr:phage tail protein [Enterobacter roggenkampii]MCU2348199.1 phage tail protein [Enterobacter roggenkampii]
MDNKLPDITLPVWMNKGEPLTLAHASKTWWERVREWLTFPLAQIDVDTCDEQLLALLAYQRDVERFPGESLNLFRLRVKYAFVNAQDAGCIAGFARIFERLEIGKIQQLERQLQYEWDVILIRINDAQLSRDNDLMMRLVRQYGRTCRRYFFDVINENKQIISYGEFGCQAEYYSASFFVYPDSIVIGANSLIIGLDYTRFVSVEVLPANAPNKDYTVLVSNDSCSVDVVDDGINVHGVSIGESKIHLETVEGEANANIDVVIKNIVSVTVESYKNDLPVFLVDRKEDFYISVENGEPDKNYRLVPLFDESVYAVYLDRTSGSSKFKLDILGSETASFWTDDDGIKLNAVSDIHRVNGSRESIDSMFKNQTSLKTISDGAFSGMRQLKTARSIFEGCRSLKDVGQAIFSDCTHLTDISFIFMGCSGLSAPLKNRIGTGSVESARYMYADISFFKTILPGLFDEMTNVKDLSYVFDRSYFLSEVPDGLFNNLANLRILDGAFNYCNRIESDINAIFNLDNYYSLDSINSLFAYCNYLTGSGLEFINKIRSDAEHDKALAATNKLSDSSSIPAGWR